MANNCLTAWCYWHRWAWLRGVNNTAAFDSAVSITPLCLTPRRNFCTCEYLPESETTSICENTFAAIKTLVNNFVTLSLLRDFHCALYNRPFNIYIVPTLPVYSEEHKLFVSIRYRIVACCGAKKFPQTQLWFWTLGTSLSWTLSEAMPWYRSTWSWSRSSGYPTSSSTTSKHLRLDRAKMDGE